MYTPKHLAEQILRSRAALEGERKQVTVLFRQALEQAGAGHGKVVAILGEPAVGKSRLFWEFTHSRRTQGWLILESSSVSYGKTTAYLPTASQTNRDRRSRSIS